MTGDERVQGRKTYSLKENVDVALEESGYDVKRVFVASRTEREVPMTPGRDVSLEEVIECVILYTAVVLCAFSFIVCNSRVQAVGCIIQNDGLNVHHGV